MDNIRKNPVKNWLDIDNVLRIENPERELLFMDAMRRVGDRKVVADFWNLLVEYGKENKTFGVPEGRLLDGSLNWIVTLLGIFAAGVTLSGVMNVHGNQDLANLTMTLANAGIIGANAVALVNDFYHQPKAQKIQNTLETMRILYPDLYDIELCFNKVDMNLIKEGDLPGRRAYKEANKIWLKAKEEGKTDDITLGFKMREKMNEIYSEQKPEVVDDEEWEFK